MNSSVFRNSKKSKTFLTILFAVISIIYILPIVTVLINSFKANAYINTETFALPTEESYVGLDNYIKGMNYGNYPFFKAVGYSLVITIFSTALILICTSMAAWYITRVNSQLLQAGVSHVRVLNGCAVPDGHVHACQNCGQRAYTVLQLTEPLA